MPATLALLLVDDDEDDYLLTRDYLREIRDQKFEITWAANYEQGMSFLADRQFDICLFDYLLGARTGLDLLRIAQEWHVRTPIVLLTGKGDTRVASEALRLGVADYLVKGELDAEKLERSIRYARERTANLRALLDSEEKYRGLFEGSVDAICLLDHAGRISDLNPAATRLCGASREGLLGRELQEFFKSDAVKTLFSNQLAQRTTLRDLEVELQSDSGDTRYCVVACTSHQTPGLPASDPTAAFFQVILHDITRRKQAEQDLLIAEKMAATGRFVRMLGHEIRNPLTNIDLSIAQLHAENQDPELDDLLEIIARNSKRIGSLLTDLLQSSTPSQLTLQPHQATDLLEAAVERALDRIKLKKINILRDYQTDLPVVQADAEKLTMALLNIVINAVEIVEAERGELRLSVRQESPGQVTIRIKDNGPGIAPEHLARIFEPYFTRKSNGLGLGLAGTLSIVQSHGGRVEVHSQVGHGAEFVVILMC